MTENGIEFDNVNANPSPAELAMHNGNGQQEPEPFEPERRTSADAGLSASIKLIHPVIRTQIRVGVRGFTATQLFEAIDDMIEQATARGYIVDQWPFRDDHGLAEDTIPLPDLSDPAAVVAFLRSPEFDSLPADQQEMVIASLGSRTTDHVTLTHQAPHQPAYLEGLEDHEGNPLMQLPEGASLPEQRPARWCAAHQIWMWQRSGQNGGTWYSHPRGDKWCKGKEAAA